MIDDKEYDERDQIGENDEDRLNDDIEVLKLGKLSSKRYIDNIDKWSDEINRIDMIYNQESDERDQVGENDKYILTDDIEFLKLWTLSSHKNIENIDKESNEINRIDFIDDREYYERDQIGEIK